MTTAQQAVDAFVAAWNEPDTQRRRELAQDAFTEDAVMVGGHETFEGVDGIADFMGRSQAEHPVIASRTSDLNAHGGGCGGSSSFTRRG